jgi:uncharacterized protein (DUF2141 family)
MFRLPLIAAAASALALIAAVPAFAGPNGDTLTLTFETGATTGAVMVVLYDSEAAYDGGQPVRALTLPANAPVVAVFDNLPAGDYAVKAFHDVNGDGQMNVSPFGMPTEPYAFSNNAVGNMGPAKWDRAHFTVSGATAQTIRIR